MRVCTSDTTALGVCMNTKMSPVVGEQFQYFAPDYYGSSFYHLMDYCPYVEARDYTRCVDGDIRAMPGSIVSASSHCFDASFARVAEPPGSVFGICAVVKCNPTTRTYTVQVHGATNGTLCSDLLDLPDLSGTFVSGSISCPPYDRICFQ